MVEVEGYHSLRGPHCEVELELPDEPGPLRTFFERCLGSREFALAQSEREQVHLCSRWARDFYNGPLTLQNLADFFGIGRSTVAYHLSRPYDRLTGCVPGRPGRPPLLTNEQMLQVREFVLERFDLKLPVSYEDIREFCLENFELVVNIKSLRNLINRCVDFRTVRGVPLEDTRLYASHDQIIEYFDQLQEKFTIGMVPASFVYNVDESGFNQFVDARTTIRIVAASYSHNSIPVGITRAEKRATLIACVSADGSAVKPLVVLQRQTIEAELLTRGYTADKVVLARSAKGFVTTELFLQWCEHVFLPDLRARRLQHGYQGPAILILDGFGCHHSPAMLEMLEEENVVCQFLPPHTSDQLQPLDLGIFAIQKRWQSNVSVDDTLNRQTKQLIKILDSYRMATTPKNVIGAFRKGGIVTYLDETLTLRVRVERACATAVRGEDDDDAGDKRRINI